MKYTVIGTGIMGAPIATRLTEKGLDVTAWNRNPQAQSRLGDKVAFSTNLVKTIKEADVLIFILSNAKATAKIIFALPHGLLKGKTIIQMATIAPQESRELLAKAEELEMEYLEAPVLGSVPEALDGSLQLMVGASDEQFERFGDLFSALGKDPLHVGIVGKAAALKLAMNQLIASLTTSFALSLGFVQREGIKVDQFMQVLRNSALYAPTFDKKLDKMLSGDYSNPNFPLKHLAKDVKLFIRAAGNMQTSMLKGVFRTLLTGIEEGHQDKDYSVLYESIDQD
jgi:3-hydroxyisobutyrate dehydrogenase